MILAHRTVAGRADRPASLARSKIAFVVSESVGHGVLRMLAAYRPDAMIEGYVFRDFDAACRWLDDHPRPASPETTIR